MASFFRVIPCWLAGLMTPNLLKETVTETVFDDPSDKVKCQARPAEGQQDTATNRRSGPQQCCNWPS